MKQQTHNKKKSENDQQDWLPAIYLGIYRDLIKRMQSTTETLTSREFYAPYETSLKRYLNDLNEEITPYLEAEMHKACAAVADPTETAWFNIDAQFSVLQKEFTYKTGEVTGAGLLICQKCDHPLKLKKPSHIPPCSRCHHTTFKRS